MKRAKDWKVMCKKIEIDNPVHLRVGDVYVNKDNFLGHKIRVEIKKDGVHITKARIKCSNAS